MAEETQYTANTGIVNIATANPNLDGTGTLGTVLTGASNGTLIKKVYIKAVSSTTQGIIRLYVDNRTTVQIIKEIEVPAIAPTGVTPSFEVELDLNFDLQSTYFLKASTEKGESFNIIAEAIDWAYNSASVRKDTTQFTTNWGSAQLAIANANRDGTGTLYTVYTAGASATFKGSSVKGITLIDTGNVTDGMIRLYIDGNLGLGAFLFREIFVPASAISDITKPFERNIDFSDNDFELQAGYSIKASTQVAEPYGFEVSVTGNDWKYLD